MGTTLSGNMMFFDVNYGEYASITGTNLYTASAMYAFDNRSDAGNTVWSTITGDITYDYGSGTYFYVDSFFINNTNIKAGNLQAYTGTSWTTLTGFSNLTETSYFYQHASTIQAYDVKMVFSLTQDSLPGYTGEFITTKQKFSLTANPNLYKPMMVPIGAQKQLYKGQSVWNEVNTVFAAEIGWNYLADAATSTGDAINMSELARKKTSFLFWPNGQSAGPQIFSWRKQDVFKCKIMNEASYEFSAPNLVNYIIANYQVNEVK